jgi:hypothetical protein
VGLYLRHRHALWERVVERVASVEHPHTPDLQPVAVVMVVVVPQVAMEFLVAAAVVVVHPVVQVALVILANLQGQAIRQGTGQGAEPATVRREYQAAGDTVVEPVATA